MNALILVLLLCLPSYSWGQPAPTQVVYVNGIQTTAAKAEATRIKIRDLLRNSTNRTVGKREFEVIYVWNPKGYYHTPVDVPECGTPCQDIQELLVMKAAEEDFKSSFEKILAPHNASSLIDPTAAADVRKYADSLVLGNNSALKNRYVTEDRMSGTKKALDELTGELRRSPRSIVVAHSQGNLLAHLAWATLASELGQELRKKVRVVNVANTSRFTVNNLNLTHDDDVALAALREAPSIYNFSRETTMCSGICLFDVGAPTFRAPGDFSCLSVLLVNQNILCKHYIVETYLSSEDDIKDVLVDHGVLFAAEKTKFADRFEDLVYAAAKSLDSENFSPVVFDNLGDRQFCIVSGGVSCQGLIFGFSPPFFTAPATHFVKMALGFEVPASSSVKLESIELAAYLRQAPNDFTLTIRPDLAGLPDPIASLSIHTVVGAMKSIFSFFTDPTNTTIVVRFDAENVMLDAGKRYWIELSTSDPATSAVWAFGQVQGFGNVASAVGAGPYRPFGAQQPAARVVVAAQ